MRVSALVYLSFSYSSHLCECLFPFPQGLKYLLPLGPLTLGQTSFQRQTRPVAVPESQYPTGRLFDAHRPPLYDYLLASRDVVLQCPHFCPVHLPLYVSIVQRHHRPREYTRQAVNDARSADGKDGEKLLAETAEGGESGQGDSRCGGDLGVMREVCVGEFTADDIRVRG